MKRKQWLEQLALQDDVAQQKARLETQIKEWTAKLNRSRMKSSRSKPSLIAMRAMHRDCLVVKLRKLERQTSV
jgi:hypothetical protein